MRKRKMFHDDDVVIIHQDKNLYMISLVKHKTAPISSDA